MVRGRVLVIAGSDSSGGAGLEADQKTIAAHGCYAMTATTALTAQNTLGVEDIHLTPPSFVKKQIDACISDVGVDVVKTGMLATAETIEIVAEALLRHKVAITVIDPVMVATTGAQLLPEEAVRLLRQHLLPNTTILTPNFPEAKLLLSEAGKAVEDPKDVEGLISIAKSVQSLGPKYVLLKGGHLPFKKDGTVAILDAEKELMVNVLYGEGQVTRIESDYYNTKNTHGTGCSLASAIASNLASGLSMIPAVKAACRYVEAGIKTATDLGHGNGPINHFHSTYTLPFTPGYFLEYLLGRPDVAKAWKEHIEHEFVAGLGDGTLPLDRFKYYLVQDYLYLIQFARASALAAFKAKTIDEIAAAAKVVENIHRETALHIAYCKDFGITKEEMESSQESQACTAYTRYVLDIGQTQDLLALQVAMAPCLIGYMHIAKRLHADPKSKREDNVYWTWIETYIGENYAEEVRVGSELLERHAVLQSASRIEELVNIFIHATKMETGFWNMGAGIQ
ncbi:putative thiamine biosynthesis protein thi-4 [Coleophoma crateriformis]|uniref:Putative thiamine biosynthesis protein thi-4 n=1 Tax=Coleophoma crateriformis TaxID=565419 RepID=A0A3D8R8C4_9HELO|nr:putative thiamine biosynthesis protein thi-4 [Coleophoma crateriformis]